MEEEQSIRHRVIVIPQIHAQHSVKEHIVEVIQQVLKPYAQLEVFWLNMIIGLI